MHFCLREPHASGAFCHSTTHPEVELRISKDASEKPSSSPAPGLKRRPSEAFLASEVTESTVEYEFQHEVLGGTRHALTELMHGECNVTTGRRACVHERAKALLT